MTQSPKPVYPSGHKQLQHPRSSRPDRSWTRHGSHQGATWAANESLSWALHLLSWPKEGPLLAPVSNAWRRTGKTLGWGRILLLPVTPQGDTRAHLVSWEYSMCVLTVKATAGQECVMGLFSKKHPGFSIGVRRGKGRGRFDVSIPMWWTWLFCHLMSQIGDSIWDRAGFYKSFLYHHAHCLLSPSLNTLLSWHEFFLEQGRVQINA